MNKKLRQQVYDKYNGHCAYCGKAIEYKDMQVDHLHPNYFAHLRDTENEESRRKQKEIYNIKGDHQNHIDNLMPACRPCNYYKRSHMLEDFRKEMSKVLERCEKYFIVRLALDYGILKEKQWNGIFYFEWEEYWDEICQIKQADHEKDIRQQEELEGEQS